MLSRLRSLVVPPVFDDEEKTRIAKFLHIIILTIISIAVLIGAADVLAGVWITAYTLALVVLPLIPAYWLARQGKVTPASYILMISLVITVTILLAVGQGIHDIGLMDYALLMIITSYLLQRKGLIIVTGLIIAAVGVVVFGEIYHFLPVRVSPVDFIARPADFFIVSLTLLMGAVAISLLSDTLTGALQQTRESEIRWHSLVDSTSDVVLLISPEGEITFVNASTLEKSQGKTVGRNIFEIVPEEAQRGARQALETALSGKSVQVEMPLYTFNGHLRWFSLRLSPILQANGQARSVVVIATSIQHLKAYEEELRASRETLRTKTEQLAMLYEIGKTVTSLQDLNGALKIILEQMKSILPLDAFIVSLYNEKENNISFPLLYEDGRLWQEDTQLLSPQGGTSAVIRTGQPYLTNCASRENGNTVNWVEVGDKSKVTESIMIAPMVVGSRVIGAISAQSYMPNMYSPEMLELLSGAASQVAVAVENAQLFEAAQKRAEQLAALNEIGRSISRLKNLENVLDDAFQQLCSLLSLDVFFIALYNAENNEISFPMMLDSGQRWTEQPSVLEAGTLLDKTIHENKAHLINRTQAEIEARRGSGLIGDRSKVAASLMMSPLVAGDRVIGVVSAQSYTINAYSEDDLSMLTSASYQIGIAIENARLYDQLQMELDERKRVEAEIRALNTGLEARVQARTAELEATSKELEGFTYTVSHDLRAPLRGIHGFSNILLEDYGKNLPPPAHEHLIRIQDSARYMGRLIDDLLNFTRIGRHPIRKGEIKMVDFVQQTFNEATRSEDLSRIEFTIGALPVVQADPMLLKQVINNLLSNAIKFSARREVAKIKIGCQTVDGKDVFYVQDNGAGFDMTYVSKLFGVFQRLHHQSEFEGTGVGLAITQRILQRHGGRIWAESVVDVGATFYFTLEP